MNRDEILPEDIVAASSDPIAVIAVQALLLEDLGFRPLLDDVFRVRERPAVDEDGATCVDADGKILWSGVYDVSRLDGQTMKKSVTREAGLAWARARCKVVVLSTGNDRYEAGEQASTNRYPRWSD